MTGLVFTGDLATLRVVLDVTNSAGIPARPPEWFCSDDLPNAEERERRDGLDRRIAGITHQAFGPVGVQTESIRFSAGSVTALVQVNTEDKAVTLEPAALFAAFDQSVENVKGPIRDYTDALMNRDARGPTRVEIREACTQLGAGALHATDPTVPPPAPPNQLTASIYAAVLVVWFGVGIAVAATWLSGDGIKPLVLGICVVLLVAVSVAGVLRFRYTRPKTT